MLERLGTASVGLLTVALALGLVAFRHYFRETVSRVRLKHFGDDRKPLAFGFYVIAFGLLLIGAFLIAKAIRGEPFVS